MKTRLLSRLPLAALAIAITGCAGMESSQSLEDARNAVQTAGNDPVVVESASIELDRAREALTRAEAIYEEEGDRASEHVAHQSYLARRYAQTAMALADEARAEEAIESAEAERNRALLEIRTAQAEQRAAEAEAARLAAAHNAREAVLAESQAAALAEQVQDLEAQRTDRGIVLTLGDILFDVDKAQLKPGADRTIAQLAEFLNDYPDRALVIEGHTDSTGPDAYNEELSERRANAVAMALEQRGVRRSRLETLGLGESEPVASNDTAAGRQQNRRVEVIVSDEPDR